MTGLEGVRGWVLDIDDTLYLERDYVRSGFAAAGRWIHQRDGVEGFCDAATALFSRGERGNIFDLALSSLGVPPDPDTVAQLVKCYREHQPDIRLEPDAAAFLSHAAGLCRLAGVSDGPLASQSGKATALGLSRWLSPLLLTEALGPAYRKPSALAFRMIEDAWGLSGSALAYVADNPLKDFHGPHALGWRTIRIRRKGGLHEALTSPDGLVNRHIETLHDIMDVVK